MKALLWSRRDVGEAVGQTEVRWQLVAIPKKLKAERREAARRLLDERALLKLC